ncbi:MAG TPA: Gldg family protein [Verrucomicrobiota bacterium]|nr:Gldg family protein [Verrucomicrobiota bacterium]HNU50998.1 Gldg family protein [Verrucomicrobiota bacterium]
MSMTKNKWGPLVYSGVGVAAMFVILAAVGVIGNTVKKRIDLTADRVYTLSEGTKKILGGLKSPVTVNFYCTQGENEMPIPLKTYAKRVEDLLDEYRQASGGKIQIRKFDPQPDSDAEDAARLDGVEGQNLSDGGLISLGDRIYLGLAVSCIDQKAAIPFLDPSRERLLEYDLTRAIAQVNNPQKATVGIMSGLPVFGQMNPMAMRMGGGQQQEPWVFLSELKRDFNVKQVEMTAEAIDEDIGVLLVVHPSGVTDKTQYALDQFVLRGGKLIALLDPLSVFDSRNSMNMQNMLQRAASGGSTLEKLLKAWGLEFDVAKVIADKNYVTMVRRGTGGPAPEPTWLSLTPEAIDANDVTTAQIDSVLLAGAGVFTGTPAAGLKQTVLLRTSANSQPVDKMMAQFGGDTTKDFSPSGKEQALALRLEGKFKTAFPDGKPGGDTKSEDDADEDAEKKLEGEAAKEKPAAASLKESARDGVVILLGDSDFIYDQFCVQVQNFLGQKLISPFNGNLGLLQNLVEQMLGDSNLIGVRSRAVQNRPFTLVRKIQAQAEEQYRARIKQLEQDLQDAQQKISELQRGKETNQRFILSKEQQDEIKRFHQKEAEAKRELKEVRKQLRREIDALETRLKWVNIAAMPFLVTVAGVSLAMVKRKKTAAK